MTDFKTMKIPLAAIFSCTQLYEFTQQPDFDSSPHKEEVLETLKFMENIRPEDINGKFNWSKT